MPNANLRESVCFDASPTKQQDVQLRPIFYSAWRPIAVAFKRLAVLFTVFLTLILAGCEKPSTIQKIDKIKTLHVITRNAPAIYYEEREGPAGYDYELVKLFAQRMGWQLDLKVATNPAQIFNALDNEYTHIAAASLSASEQRAERFIFSPPYLEASTLAVYRYGTTRPRKIEDLYGKVIGVVSESHIIEQLEDIQKDHPELRWHILEAETIDLMRLVQEREIDVGIMTTKELDIHQAYYPRVKKAFVIGEPSPIVWYLPKSTDTSLMEEVERFFAQIEEDGTLLQLKERYFGHLGQLNYVGARTFIKHINTRLPQYIEAFKSSADNADLDWRLLAAMGYQESHWKANATSPTGVRGLMMLTRITAKEMGIENRLDPTQSIIGGANYFAKIKKRIPSDIQEPDRTWFALASYNVGYGHLEDARVLTEKAGKDPDKWIDVKEHLPLLQKKKYYKQTRHGYARGNEPVIYVQNIRRYFDVLNWMSQAGSNERAVAISQPQPALPTAVP